MWLCKISARLRSLTKISPDRNGPDLNVPDQNGPDRNGSDRIGQTETARPKSRVAVVGTTSLDTIWYCDETTITLIGFLKVGQVSESK